MITHIIEATQQADGDSSGFANWGKFLVAKFDEDEWGKPSSIAQAESLLGSIGWAPDHIIVFDLQTCEGAGFNPHGLASADLNKHKIWVCPMYEPFLIWLYQQDLSDITKLPHQVVIPEAEFALYGYRRGQNKPAPPG